MVPSARERTVLILSANPSIRLSGSTSEPPFELPLGQLHDRRPAVHVVRRQGSREQAPHQLPRLLWIEVMPGLDRRPAGEGRGETLQPVRPATEASARQIAHQLLQTPGGLEARMRIGRGVRYDRAPRKRL